MAFELKQSDMEALLQGGCFFGSGGGGTITSARHLAQNFIAGDYYPTASVRVVDVAEAINGDAVMVAYLGAPVAINQVQYPDGPVKAVAMIKEHLEKQGRKLAYIVPPESGALGFVVACLVAAHFGLEVVDADGAGRAVPSLPMLTFAAEGLNPRPTMLVSQQGLQVELDVTPRGDVNGCSRHQQDVAAIIEQMVRPIVAEQEFGQFGGLAMWIMDTETLARGLPIRGTLNRALRLGRMLQQRELGSAAEMVRYLEEKAGLGARTLFGPGSITAVKEDTSGGFDVGKVTLESEDGLCTVVYQNESLLAWNSAQGQPIGMAPDSLTYFVEGEGQQVFSNGDLLQADGTLNPQVQGRPVSVIGIGAAAPLRVPGGLILDSFMEQVAQLGYLGPYLPLFEQGAVK
ncbi:DUF917 domain-containing protein [Rugamonas aquatica]|uniref:DUF917 family protein n=1 Tax=Rugamonas aquatica TaxID=2743357 RepID=A0A6A7MW24_9BURK|nr:DUF917 domain-containing protein [Rugamonas aquatica]MQA37040.1 DUF917 family protein [Rugamonas aquatica]